MRKNLAQDENQMSLAGHTYSRSLQNKVKHAYGLANLVTSCAVSTVHRGVSHAARGWFFSHTIIFTRSFVVLFNVLDTKDPEAKPS